MRRMRDHSTLFQRAALGQVLFLVWCLAYLGVDPLQINTVPAQIVLVLAAAVLLIGSLPGMFLARALASLGERGAARLTVVFAVALPLGLMLVGVLLALDSYRIYALEQDPVSLWRLVFDGAIVLTQAVSLGVNLVTLSSPAKPGSQGSGA